MSERPLTWVRDPRPTTTILPPGATDCHCHVFGPVARFPYPDASLFKPADAPKESLFALHDRMGIERCVIVQSGCHGFDNRVVEDAMRARPGRYLGVALVPADAPDATLDQLAARGFRGVRFNYMAHLADGASPAQLRELAPRLADRGLHLQIHMDAGRIEAMTPVLASLPVTVVIDHMGRVDASQGLGQPAFRALLGLLEHPHLWCKISGSERLSRREAPWEDATPFARAIVERFGDRVVWGTDWPHPNFRAAPPDDGDIVDLVPRMLPTEALRQAVLVDNPTRLYRFEEN